MADVKDLFRSSSIEIPGIFKMLLAVNPVPKPFIQPKKKPSMNKKLFGIGRFLRLLKIVTSSNKVAPAVTSVPNAAAPVHSPKGELRSASRFATGTPIVMTGTKTKNIRYGSASSPPSTISGRRLFPIFRCPPW